MTVLTICVAVYSRLCYSYVKFETVFQDNYYVKIIIISIMSGCVAVIHDFMPIMSSCVTVIHNSMATMSNCVAVIYDSVPTASVI